MMVIRESEISQASVCDIEAANDLEVAFPPPNESLEQDEEWCVVEVDGEWRRVRLHDYNAIYAVPGLYEKVIYETLACRSPEVVCGMLDATMKENEDSIQPLRVLDLGAGNGIVGGLLRQIGAEYVAGVDIVPEAANAVRRDRPGVYDAYHVADITRPDDATAGSLESARFNGLVCVAALGFGDIPPDVFNTAFRYVEPNGWVAFNIKSEFLDASDPCGFAGLIDSMSTSGALKILCQKRYPHRLGTDGTPIHYHAIIARKRGDI
jgi:SAM-dependent methyltransferase